MNSRHILVGAAVIWIVMIAINIFHPYVFDESSHIIVAENIADSGKPLAYWGELHDDFVLKSTEDSSWQELLHFPLLNIVYATVPLLGAPLIGYRMINILAFLLALFFISVLSTQLFKKNAQEIRNVAIAIVLIIPLTTTMSLLLTHETSVFLIAFILFTYCCIQLIKTDNRSFLLWAAAAFALCIWAKESPSFLLLPPLCIWYFLRKDWKKSFLYPLTIGILGISIFLVTWIWYAHFAQIDWLTPFIYMQHRTFGAVSVVVAAKIFLRSIYDWFWFSPAFLFLGIAAIVSRMQQFQKSRALELIDFLVLQIVFFYIPFSIKVSATLYKYPLFVPLALVVAQYVQPYLSAMAPKRWIIMTGVLTLVYIVLPDPLLIAPLLLPFHSQLLPLYGGLMMYFAIPLVAFFGIRRHKRVCIFVLLGLVAAISISQNTAIASKESSLYFYGEEGYGATLDFLQQYNATTVAVMRLDMYPYTRFRFYPDDLFTERNHCGLQNSQQERKGSPCGLPGSHYIYSPPDIVDEVDIVVHSKYLEEATGPFIPEVQQKISADFHQVFSAGHFTVWERI